MVLRNTGVRHLTREYKGCGASFYWSALAKETGSINHVSMEPLISCPSHSV